ncbi:GNAT family N-acetyltransferase [Noviherbaspirillum sp. L7-7A]|uniref:GNAT family N-acetyltransferase n=1 Tax=Noviherbaspirillum sp. L7-7A TaxID=2850560 RepID=UPI001C2CA833|nr:GNAT family N-acetyltransferase [Noviherbaspirillum sp. L7-7A]MBV0881261.1 GNAT family N-acetyltransferase [Noviherbaspirillum sp. L7-7A]
MNMMDAGTLPDIELRVAVEDDAALLAALQAEMDDGDPAATTDADHAAMRAVLADMAAYPHFRAYIVYKDNQPVASFSLMIFASPSQGGQLQALLDAVVVSRAQRGRGIGEVMVREALFMARQAGCYKLILSSNLKRRDAHRFYEQLGFRQHGISYGMPLKGHD